MFNSHQIPRYVNYYSLLKRIRLAILFVLGYADINHSGLGQLFCKILKAMKSMCGLYEKFLMIIPFACLTIISVIIL